MCNEHEPCPMHDAERRRRRQGWRWRRHTRHTRRRDAETSERTVAGKWTTPMVKGAANKRLLLPTTAPCHTQTYIRIYVFLAKCKSRQIRRGDDDCNQPSCLGPIMLMCCSRSTQHVAPTRRPASDISIYVLYKLSKNIWMIFKIPHAVICWKSLLSYYLFIF